MTIMKKSIAIGIALMVFTAGSLPAQEVNYYRAKQQAYRDSAQNDAEQQRISQAANGPGGAAPASGAAGPAAPMDPALQATLKNVTSLQSDFTALIQSTADQPDPAQKVSLLNNLTQAAQGDKKASANSVKKLADDLATALAGRKKMTAAQQKQLAGYVHAVFNGAHLKDAQQTMIFNGAQKILTDSGASLDGAVDVVTDLKAVVAETK
jgi:hypothetical protein